MTEPDPDTNYPVFVSVKRGTYDLRIRELLLRVQGTDLQEAYAELIQQKEAIINSARAFGTLGDLPSPVPPPLPQAPRSDWRFRRFWTTGR